MKTCTKCNETQPLAEFYTNFAKCKNCTRRDVREREQRLSKNPEWRLSERRRHREKSRRYRSEGKDAPVPSDKKRKAVAKYIGENPQKRAAHLAVQNAVESGSILKQPCEVCGNPKAQAHHDDYTKPLQVRWLCVPHHNEHHVKMRELEILSK